MKVLRVWGPVILWMSLIFLGSTRQRIVVSPAETINFLFFKTLHVLEYGVLYVLTFRAVKISFPRQPARLWVIWSFIIVLLFATSDELHQLFVATREGRVRDVIIDGLGAGLAWITIAKLLPKMPVKLRKSAHQWLGI